MTYPKDADGEALSEMAAGGCDMSKPMIIEFAVIVPNPKKGKKIARKAARIGYYVELVFEDEEEEGTCYCSKHMVPNYDDIVAAQVELDKLSKPFGGYSDGWGSWGNEED